MFDLTTTLWTTVGVGRIIFTAFMLLAAVLSFVLHSQQSLYTDFDQ